MKLFSYKAADKKGKVITGEKKAESRKEVVDYLYSQELIPLVVKEVSGGAKLRLPKGIFPRRVGLSDVMMFFRSLAVLLNAGVPMDRALAICSEVSENPSMRVLIESIRYDVRGGSSLSDALMKYPKVFSRLYVNMIRAGESGGMLPAVLDRIHRHIERTMELRETVISSTIYPAFLILTGIASVVVLIVFVVPKFSEIFSSMGVSPPFPLPLLASMGGFFGKNWPIILMLLLLTPLGIKLWLKKEENRERAYAFLLKLPFIGRILVKAENVKFCSNLGALLENGVPMLKALSIVKEMFSNPLYRASLDEVYRRVREGERLSKVLVPHSLWHPLVVGLCEVGEETGTLGEMLMVASTALEKELEGALKKGVALIEPVTILGMGLLVGSIVVSMISAIFSVNDIVR